MKINVVDKLMIEGSKDEISLDVLNRILDHTLGTPTPAPVVIPEVVKNEPSAKEQELVSRIAQLEKEIAERDEKYQKLLSTVSLKKEEKPQERVIVEKRSIKKINYTECLSPMTIQVSNWTLVNCCNHDITIVQDDGKTIIIPPSGINSRIASELIDGVSLFGLKLKTPDDEAEAIDIPEERPRTLYIVSSFVYDSLPDRIDFVCPYAMGKNTVRDRVTGEVLGVRGLVAREALIEKLKLELK